MGKEEFFTNKISNFFNNSLPLLDYDQYMFKPSYIDKVRVSRIRNDIWKEKKYLYEKEKKELKDKQDAQNSLLNFQSSSNNNDTNNDNTLDIFIIRIPLEKHIECELLESVLLSKNKSSLLQDLSDNYNNIINDNTLVYSMFSDGSIPLGFNNYYEWNNTSLQLETIKTKKHRLQELYNKYTNDTSCINSLYIIKQEEIKEELTKLKRFINTRYNIIRDISILLQNIELDLIQNISIYIKNSLYNTYNDNIICDSTYISLSLLFNQLHIPQYIISKVKHISFDEFLYSNTFDICLYYNIPLSLWWVFLYCKQCLYDKKLPLLLSSHYDLCPVCSCKTSNDLILLFQEYKVSWNESIIIENNINGMELLSITRIILQDNYNCNDNDISKFIKLQIMFIKVHETALYEID